MNTFFAIAFEFVSHNSRLRWFFCRSTIEPLSINKNHLSNQYDSKFKLGQYIDKYI